MAALELALQRRFSRGLGGVFNVVLLCAASVAAVRHGSFGVGIGVALEAVDEAAGPRVFVGRGLAVGGRSGRLVRAGLVDALFLVDRHGGGGEAGPGGGPCREGRRDEEVRTKSSARTSAGLY